MANIYANLKALVVDDSPTMRAIIADTIQEIGFNPGNIREARDGGHALEALQAAAVDLIISDWNMPNMDGFALLKAVKQRPEWQRTRFLMVTSESEEEKKMEAFHSGADQYVVKPFTPNSLALTIAGLLQKNDAFAGKTALLVDEAAPMRQIMRKNLAQAGFADANILAAGDGEEAMKILLRSKTGLVLTEWHLPKIDGLELVRRMKTVAALKNVPVIMVTSVTEKEKIIAALQTGLSGYIIKPFNAIDLQSKIRQVIAVRA